MKAILICPAVRPAFARLSETMPLVTLPILGENLVNHWLEHVAALGAREVTVIVADRSQHVRAAIGDGCRWGLRVKVVEAHAETGVEEAAARYQADGNKNWLSKPHDIVVMDCLPGCPDQPLFESYAGWVRALLAWLPRAQTPARVCVKEIQPGVWVGTGGHISPTAALRAPCWIGEGVTVGAGAIVGPGAVVEDHAVIGADARVMHSIVGPDTFVGQHVCVANSLAVGSLLINWRTESILRVPDAFLLCSLAALPALLPGTSSATRALAILGRIAEKPRKLFSALLRTDTANRADFPPNVT